MAIKNFNFPVQAGITETHKPKLNVVQYADGYKQRSSKGINNDLREFAVVYKGTWNENGAEILAVENFLNEHKGYKAFMWESYRVPNQNSVKVVCPEWSVDRQQGYCIISMKFEETL